MRDEVGVVGVNSHEAGGTMPAGQRNSASRSIVSAAIDLAKKWPAPF